MTAAGAILTSSKEVWTTVAHAPSPPSHTEPRLEATALALQMAALVVAIAWGILGAVEGVFWMPLLPVVVLGFWQRPGYGGVAFLVLALLVCLPLAAFAYGFADTRMAGLQAALAVAVPPLLIAALLISASRLTERAARLRRSEPGPSPS